MNDPAAPGPGPGTRPAPAQGPASASARALRVLVAAGPTHEPIDAVRFIGNRSSGRMGTAIAEAFLRDGCAMTLARGPGVPAVAGCVDRRFSTAADLLGLLRSEWPAHDVLVMAAAVADYRPESAVPGKMRREDGPVTLRLVPTQDILGTLAAESRPDQFVVGFALERPEDLLESAAAKLRRKRADAIVANPLETMDAPDADARLLLADGRTLAPAGGKVPKGEFAAWLARQVIPMARERADSRTRT